MQEIILHLQCHKLASVAFRYSISDTVKPVMSVTLGSSQIQPTYTDGQVTVNAWHYQNLTVQLSLVQSSSAAARTRHWMNNRKGALKSTH